MVAPDTLVSISSRELEVLRRRAAELDSHLHKLADIYFRLTHQGHVVAFQAHEIDDLYLPPAAFLQRVIWEVLPAEVVPDLQAAFSRCIATQSLCRAEYSLHVPRGVQRFEVAFLPADDAHVAAFVRNITGQWRVQQKLEETLSLVRATLDSTGDGILVVDTTGRMVDWNRRFVEMWGIPEELLALRDDEATIRFVLEQLLAPQAFLDRVHEVYAHPEVESCDLLIFKDGRAVERYSRPQRCAAQIVGRVWSFRDVTERRRVELERDRLLAEAQAAVEIRDEFLSIASHELRTPLTSLQLTLQMVQKSLRRATDARADLDPETKSDARPEAKSDARSDARPDLRVEARPGARPDSRPDAVPDILLSLPAFFPNAVETAVRQGRLLTRLVDDLLSVARIRMGRLDLNLETFALDDLCRDVIAALREPLAQAGCVVTLSAAVVVGRWDRVRLSQVLTNLLTNALRYGAGAPVAVTVREDGAQAVLSVRDHGVGIAPEAQERIFARFERLASSSHYGGLGLGLYIVRQIVGAHGGQVTVHSQLGSGSTFTITLPLAPDAPQNLATLATLATPPPLPAPAA